MRILYKQLIIICLFTLTSCATYYEVNREFNSEFERGNLEQADATLAKSKKVAKGKEQLLYFMNRGVVLSMLGNYEESNKFFEQAYIYTEDYQINYLNEATAYLTNPMVVAYKGEDHERLFILYYKALNFLQMGRYDEALVECKRMDIRLQQLSDRYKQENKFQYDAFIHVMMGIIYDAQKDYNNAFIAYRNALNYYKTHYTKLFGMSAPHQLKEDILRTSYQTGFFEEFETFKKEFEMPDYKYQPHDGANLVFFWNNGLGPVKSEWSINFAVIPGAGGVFNITNDELGFTFPFSVQNDDDKSSLKDLEFFRVAFPKYVERNEFFYEGALIIDGKTHKLELAEDINAIAFKSLQQRMVLEMGKSLLRVALKKAAEKQIDKEQEGLAVAVSFFNALTEKADTRNWQTLPHSIYYTRVPIGVDSVNVQLKLKGGSRVADDIRDFSYAPEKGQTIFQTFYSLEYQHKIY